MNPQNKILLDIQIHSMDRSPTQSKSNPGDQENRSDQPTQPNDCLVAESLFALFMFILVIYLGISYYAITNAEGDNIIWRLYRQRYNVSAGGLLRTTEILTLPPWLIMVLRK